MQEETQARPLTPEDYNAESLNVGSDEAAADFVKDSIHFGNSESEAHYNAQTPEMQARFVTVTTLRSLTEYAGYAAEWMFGATTNPVKPLNEEQLAVLDKVIAALEPLRGVAKDLKMLEAEIARLAPPQEEVIQQGLSQHAQEIADSLKAAGLSATVVEISKDAEGKMHIGSEKPTAH